MKKSFIAVALALAAFATAQVDVNKTVVVINGEEIKGTEYYHRMEYLSGVGKPMSRGIAEFPPGFLTIEQLITERLVFQLAKKKGVYPSDPEVDNELSIRMQENPKLLEEWMNGGGTQEELKYTVRLQLAQFKIATAGINVTDQDVETYYKGNPRIFTLAKKVKLAVIVVRDSDAAAKVDAALKAKKSFAEVAKTYSVDVTKSIGGEMGSISVPMLSKEVQDAIAPPLKIGETTGWLTTSDAQVKFLLQDVTPEKKLELDAKLKRQIRKDLMLTRGGVKNNVKKEMDELRTQANIDIKDKVFADAYARFMEAYKKENQLKGGGD